MPDINIDYNIIINVNYSKQGVYLDKLSEKNIVILIACRKPRPFTYLLNKIKMSRGGLSLALKRLTHQGYLRKNDAGLYVLTDKGQRLLMEYEAMRLARELISLAGEEGLLLIHEKVSEVAFKRIYEALMRAQMLSKYFKVKNFREKFRMLMEEAKKLKYGDIVLDEENRLKDVFERERPELQFNVFLGLIPDQKWCQREIETIKKLLNSLKPDYFLDEGARNFYLEASKTLENFFEFFGDIAKKYKGI
ncbi:MAG: hypothetical protein DRJ47_00405 [Thermoprotei archaeon]|nr:MAG: hypothetical protein DRJ47_00405 [Thermoprotei archaeon]